MRAINQVPALAGVEAGVTSAGWQLTLWHAISRISDVSWTHRCTSLNYVANRKCNNVTTDYSMWWWFSTHHIWLPSTALATRHLLLLLLLWFTDFVTRLNVIRLNVTPDRLTRLAFGCGSPAANRTAMMWTHAGTLQLHDPSCT